MAESSSELIAAYLNWFHSVRQILQHSLHYLGAGNYTIVNSAESKQILQTSYLVAGFLFSEHPSEGYLFTEEWNPDVG